MNLATRIVVGGINIAATPHPSGIYRTLLESVANLSVGIGGADFAKLTQPELVSADRNVMTGRICVWTEIEKKGDWFNKETNDRASDEDKEAVQIPEQIAPNYRYFQYAIDLTKHVLMFEMKTELNHSF